MKANGMKAPAQDNYLLIWTQTERKLAEANVSVFFDGWLSVKKKFIKKAGLIWFLITTTFTASRFK